MPSKPNLIGFKVSIGIFGNKKIADANRILKKEISGWRGSDTVTFFEMVLGYAAENQVDGDYRGYTDEDFHRLVFLPRAAALDLIDDLKLDFKKSQKIVNAYRRVLLIKDGKISSWKLFNKTIANHAQASKRNQENARIGQETRRTRRKQDLRALQNGKPLTDREEYLGTDEEQAPPPKAASRADKEKIEWNGKRWYPSELQKEVDRLREQIVEHKKNKPHTATGNEGIQTLCEEWTEEANSLEKLYASALSALQRRTITPRVHKLPKPAPKPFPFQPLESTEDKEKAEAARKEFAGLAEKL